MEVINRIYRETWSWSPRSNPAKVTWFLPEGTSIYYGRMYIYGELENWEADLDENNTFSIQLHYKDSDDNVTEWDYLKYTADKPSSSLVNFEIALREEDLRGQYWFLRQKGTEHFRASVEEF